ncbi:hypothetical protein DZC30_18730 [Comamonas testosteroni]|uniref:Uncharacterized protein n=1 Tax=Comamonas testosteroni TaxID=285 RepID=A0A373FCZ6_COMTE|nr:hypothetical protein [Comamonas testosteroni]RGE41345.1 hypothetical protein DZC30_18730 [Comamonas testosteroni]
MAWEFFALITWMVLIWCFIGLVNIACGRPSLLLRFLSTLGVSLSVLGFTLISVVLARYWGLDRLVSISSLMKQAFALAIDLQLLFKILVGFCAMQVLFFAEWLLQKKGAD